MTFRGWSSHRQVFRLPTFTLTVSQFSPATYVASALRQVLLGPVTDRVWLDIGVLVVLAVVLLRWVETRLAWRRRAG